MTERVDTNAPTTIPPMALPRFQPRRFEPRLLIGRGSRATEAFLLAEIDRRLAEAESNPVLLAKPVRVVVPSRSLRLHLGAAITRHRGRSAAGLLIQTHFHLALEVIERAGESLQAGRWLAELLPERGARQTSDLARPLAGLVDGFAAVLPTVRDLLDARFEPALFEGLDEVLEQEGPKVATRRQVARARALLEVAQETAAQIEKNGLGWPATVLTRAADLLEARGEALLPARAVLLHGYADATGVVTDLVQALQRRFGAWVLLDRPPDPADRSGGHRSSAGPGPEGRFGEEFVQRLQQTASPQPFPEPTPGTSSPPKIELFTAQGTAGEVREVARRIAARFGEDARPEGIAVVARDLAPYRREIRRRFSLLGLPYSALGEAGAPTPAERRARATLDLLRRGRRTPTERWIEAMERLPAPGGRTFGGVALMDLRLGLATLGAGRLQDTATLDLDASLGERTALPLPVRQGIRSEAVPDRDEGPEDQEGDEDADDREDSGEAEASEVRVLRRTLGRSVLEAAVTAARRLLSVLDHWPRQATSGEHRERLERLVVGELGWSPHPPGLLDPHPRPLLTALAALDREAPPGFTLSFDELRRLLARMLDARPAGPENALGGRGGGIQVLSITEARGRTFDHLFLLGCNRGVFPRPIREDPLLPDALRKLLRPLLPDIPIKDIGFDEERYLFAQLLSASPRVTLSWQEVDDTGAVRPPSPLVERLGLVRDAELGTPAKAEPAWTVSAAAAAGPLPPAEAATLVALHEPRSAFREVFPLAVTGLATGLPTAKIATARLAVLDEQDPDLSTPEGRAAAARLGPFFGFVGATEANETQPDPRRRDLWVTTMERLTGCPWQVFLTRLLGIEPTPDPLAALPGIDPLLLGKTVHRTLEALVTLPGGPALGDETATLDAIRERSPVRPPWPEDAVLDELLAEAARTTLLEEGQALPGLTRALARAARPYLDSVRESDWRSGPPEVLGIEVRGSLPVPAAAGRDEAAQRLLRFRADRVDRHPEGRGLVLTDYKTGRPPRNNGNEGKKEETRRGYLLRDVRSGQRLQAVAYALAGSFPDDASAIGRYLFLRSDTEHREREIGPADPDFARDFAPAFHRAVKAGLGAWVAGAFFPRVVDPQGEQEPKRCSWCPVAEACVRGDSGARLRLADRAKRQGLRATDPAEAAQLALWWLGEEP